MLAIQSALPKITFEAKNRREQQPLTPEQLAEMQAQRQYEEDYNLVDNQRNEFMKLANDPEIPMPDELKKVFRLGACLTTAILGGMAAGWGAGKTIKGIEKLAKSEFIKDPKVQLKALNKFIKENKQIIKTNYINSEAYKLNKARLEKAHKSKFWGPVLDFFGELGKGVKFAWGKIKDGTKYVIDKLKNTKVEILKKRTQNTVAVAGGIGSGTQALEKDKKQKNKHSMKSGDIY